MRAANDLGVGIEMVDDCFDTIIIDCTEDINI